MVSFQTNIHMAQAGLSAYSLFHAYISITNLRKWESTSERAAQYSKTAAQELHKTRTTQTSGALAILCSLSCALFTIGWPLDSASGRIALNAFNAGVCALAQLHVSNFWSQKGKIPMVQSYNDAINSTLIIKRQLGILAIAWLLTTLFEALTLFA
ncbi:uncharacterized protein PV09_02674 [Verruconis gallopava]|uniref:Uncharacterized protein n=1 Tax=Verruconis gallopava TaxID=253628 RepID=A0A0D2B4N1_9PEZI|nr:uncharacterized protein PV09_02674 [Verruconis gallopava]KIW06194.1 hypothetical protein PV09_02674 [Verruconis gallopava]